MDSLRENKNKNTTIQVIDHGDLFESGMQTLVNPINCQRTMGKGLALTFKQRFPRMFNHYSERCNQKLVKLGEPYLWKERTNLYILNFPTKDDWREKSNLEEICKGLDYLAEHAKQWGITSLAIPALGCGLGGLDAEQVVPVMEAHLKVLQESGITIKIYKDGPKVEHTAKKRKLNSPLSQTQLTLTQSLFSKPGRGTPPLDPETENTPPLDTGITATNLTFTQN
jgi:O-acetyl-ADP-ribose deacetylase (regulator of RNase III)